VGDEGDVRIGVTKHRNELLAHRASEPAVVTLLELHCVGEPSDRVADRAHRKLDQHVAVGGRVVVAKQACALGPDIKAEPHEIPFAAVHPAGLDLRLIEDVAGIEIAQAHPPWMLALGQCHSTAVVEIEPDGLGTFLGRDFGRRRVSALVSRQGLLRRNGTRNRSSQRALRAELELLATRSRGVDKGFALLTVGRLLQHGASLGITIG
jgi:hypothetical protein